MSSTVTYSPAPDALFQPVADESVLLDLKSERYFSLDQVGTRIWQLLDEHKTIDGVVAQMLQEFDVQEEVLRADVEALVAKLVAAGLIVEA